MAALGYRRIAIEEDDALGPPRKSTGTSMW
jgi:hypothetical protein